MKEDMRGLFFIIKGQYRRNKGIKFFNEVSGDYNHIGGYDPEDTTNEKWYMLVDRETYTTLSCGSDLNKILKMVNKYITTYKTKDKYLKMLRSLEVSSAPSPIHRRLQQEIDSNYGDYFSDLIEEQEDLAYESVHDEMVNPLYKKTKKRLVKKTTPNTFGEVVKETPKTPQVETPKNTLVKPKKKFGIKKLSMTTK